MGDAGRKRLVINTLIAAGLWSQLHAQEFRPVNFSVFDIKHVNELVSYIESSKYKSHLMNLPVRAFTLGERVCAFYEADIAAPSLRWRNPRPLLDAGRFIACSGAKPISVSYVYEQIVKTGNRQPVKDILKQEGIDNLWTFWGMLDYVALSDRLLIFYLYGNVSKETRGLQRNFRIRTYLLVKQYDADLKLAAKHKLFLGEQIASLYYHPGMTHISEVVVKKVDTSHFVVVYGMEKGERRDEKRVSLFIRYYDKELKEQNSLVINLPFESAPKDIRASVVPERKELLLTFPAILTVEDAKNKGILGKLLGKGTMDVGLVLLVYRVNLEQGTYDYVGVNLGNPQKDVHSYIAKYQNDEQALDVVLIWGLKRNSVGADIVRVKIGEDIQLEDKQTFSFTKPVEAKQVRIISDVVETRNHYMLLTFDQSVVEIVEYEDGKVESWHYEIINSHPLLTIFNKHTKQVRAVPLGTGNNAEFERIATRYLFYVKGTGKVRNYDRDLLRFVKISDNSVMAIFPVREELRYLPLRYRKSAYVLKANYMVIEDLGEGTVEISSPRLLSPSSSASTLGGRAVLVRDGKLYMFYSIDNYVPAVAVWKQQN